MNKKKPLIFFLSILFIILPSSQILSLNVEDLVDQLDKKYNFFKDIKMEFTQSISSDIFESKREFGGKLCIKNPDKFRVETPHQTIVTNGKYIWVYSEENKQVTKREYNPAGGVLLPYRYLSSFKHNYKAKLSKDEKVEKRWCYKLVLIPKDENSYISKMMVWVDRESLLTLSLKYWDLNDNEVTFIFKNIKINSKIENSKFIFEIPVGVELLDLSE